MEKSVKRMYPSFLISLASDMLPQPCRRRWPDRATLRSGISQPSASTVAASMASAHAHVRLRRRACRTAHMGLTPTAPLTATLALTSLWLRGMHGRMWMCRRSLCLVKGRKIGLRRRYALKEGASTVAVGVGAGWRQQRRRVGRAVGEARVARCQGEGRATCRGCAREDQKVYARGGGGGCRAVRGKAAHGASRLGNRTLRQLGRML